MKPVLSIAKELMRSFTEFTLRQKGRPFVSLRVTDGEGFRMTLRRDSSLPPVTQNDTIKNRT
jgi:hypothetical protein